MGAAGMRSPTDKAAASAWRRLRRLATDPGALFDTALKKKRAAGLLLLAALLALFVVFSRIPKLGEVQDDLEAATGPQVECFQGFCIEADPDTTFLERWWRFSLTYLRLVAAGMTFAFLVAGAIEAFIFPGFTGREFAAGGLKGALKGLIVGPAMTLCSACIVPVSAAFRSRGASIEATISIAQGSSTLNLPALVMTAMVFAPMIGGTRILLSVAGAILIGPIAALAAGQLGRSLPLVPADEAPPQPDGSTWRETLSEAGLAWLRSSLKYLLRLGPIMVIAGFASGLVIQWIDADTVSNLAGNHLAGVAIAATVGLLINVPLLFEIPLVAALLLVGMGAAPAATLLFTAAAAGPITFWGLARVMPKRAIAAFAASAWVIGLAGGLGVLALGTLLDADESGLRTRTPTVAESLVTLEALAQSSDVTPFTNVAPDSKVLRQGYQVWNDRPGVAVFDYDRDGDLDFYITSETGHANWLYRNDGDGSFTNVAAQAGVDATGSNSTGVAACDIDNDGFQDLYVGAWGVLFDNLGFRSPVEAAPNRDRLYLNDGNGAFRDITDSAFGNDANLRSATSIACADVDGDGWLDIYVANLLDNDFRIMDRPDHPGHYNTLYRNNGDLTFTEMSRQAGLRGPQVLMRTPDGEPILFEDPLTGKSYEGYDPARTDKLGNRVGDPTGQTHAVLFFDYDDDGDPDLWVANDGDRLHLYRNDSTPGSIRFTPVAAAVGVDSVGSWMGFALGDYDGDADLDVFVTNIGFHPLLRPPVETPRGTCEYHMPFDWGTCSHFLLRNDGTKHVPGADAVGSFEEVAHSTVVAPSPFLPPPSLDPANIHPAFEAPDGLAAYDFGFGATFFDYDNDGAQDLYWLGSTIARGGAPGGEIYPGAGRMLRGDGAGAFEDITVRARLLNIAGANYVKGLKLDPQHHENGKGLAHGDLNGDGYVDLIGTNSSGPGVPGPFADTPTPELTPGPIFLWLNGGGDHHWITLRLVGRMAVDGTGSNADAVGARVYVKTRVEGSDTPLVQVQEVIAGSGYISMSSTDLEFGLGSAATVDEIVITWPSGRTQTLTDVPANQLTTITEPAE